MAHSRQYLDLAKVAPYSRTSAEETTPLNVHKRRPQNMRILYYMSYMYFVVIRESCKVCVDGIVG